MTTMKQAELFRQEEEYRAARNSIELQPGIPAVQAEAKALLEAVKAICDAIRNAGHVDLDCEMDVRQLPRALCCIITNREVSLAAC